MNHPAPYEPRVPSDSMPPGRAALSVTWAALPFLSLGWATPFTFAGAAVWRRSGHLVVATLIYLAIFAFQLKLAPDVRTDDVAERLMGACMAVQAIVGSFHAFLVRRQVFDPDGVAGLSGNEAAIEQVRRKRLLRTRARELAAEDPGLARELRIGRPDLPRRYDDGGLIDINSAPLSVLASLPGITEEMADRITRIREKTGGFLSAEEVSTLAALPPALTADLAEYGIFLR
jgi:helix-hairpin-helix protein